MGVPVPLSFAAWLPLGVAAFGLVLVAPGFGVGWLLERMARMSGPALLPGRQGAAGAAFTLAIAWSAIAAGALGAVVLSLGVFSGRLLAAGFAVLAVLGLRDLLRAAWRGRHAWPVVVFVIALSLPWMVSVTASGFPPAQTFQWYYWDLARQLELAGGIPSWVAEYGLRLEWLPNYIFSDVASAAYRSFFPASAELAALVAWRVPLLLTTLAALYLAVRLWLDRAPALVAVGAAGASDLILTKFSSYRPEALGILLGLVALWLVVDGLRESKRSRIVLGGGVLGVAAGFHPIPATALGLFLVAAVVVEWRGGSAVGRRSIRSALARAAVLAAAIVLATGWVLQDRVSPLEDTANPDVSAREDPTWSFLSRSEGLEPGADRPSRGDQVLSALREPWPGIDLAARPALLVPIIVGIAVALVLSSQRSRRLAAMSLLAALALSAPIGFFALSETYIPQYTGLVRLAQYLSLLLAFAVGLAFEGYRAAVTALGFRLETPVRGGLTVGVAVVAWSIPTVSAEFARAPRLSEDALDALAEVRRASDPGDQVLSNAATRGTLTFFTRREAPLEGRQPVLEDPRVLELATERLAQTEAFFNDPTERPLPEGAKARWIVVTECPGNLGAMHAYGADRGALDRIRPSRRFARVWRGRCTDVFENAAGERHQASVGPATPRVWRLAVGAGGLAIVPLVVLLWPRLPGPGKL